MNVFMYIYAFILHIVCISILRSKGAHSPEVGDRGPEVSGACPSDAQGRLLESEPVQSDGEHQHYGCKIAKRMKCRT